MLLADTKLSILVTGVAYTNLRLTENKNIHNTHNITIFLRLAGTSTGFSSTAVLCN